MSSYIAGGGRAAYRLESLNLDCIIKSPLSSTSWASKNSSSSSSSSSPSSTLSESTNSTLAISTRKPRTPRKRPNQTYNEAAAILSTAYPKIFTNKNVTKPMSIRLVKSQESNADKSQSLYEPTDLINMPFQVTENSEFLLNPPVLGQTLSSKRFEKPCLSPGEINSQARCSSEICHEPQGDFESGSIVLHEEITDEGIDSIMKGNVGMEKESAEDPKTCYYSSNDGSRTEKFSYGYPVMGLGLEFGYGNMRKEFRALRNSADDGDWWRFPTTVNVSDLTPKMEKKAKKKKKKVENKRLLSDLIKDYNPCPKATAKNQEKATAASDEKASEGDEEGDVITPLPNAGLLLKLNYDEVLSTWADNASPFSGEEFAGNDVQARLAQIDLFSENGGGGLIREASVMRYKEKRRNRLFSKKIRYQVRKVNADRRPRMKGRFVRTPNSSEE